MRDKAAEYGRRSVILRKKRQHMKVCVKWMREHQAGWHRRISCPSITAWERIFFYDNSEPKSMRAAYARITRTHGPWRTNKNEHGAVCRGMRIFAAAREFRRNKAARSYQPACLMLRHPLKATKEETKNEKCSKKIYYNDHGGSNGAFTCGLRQQRS